MEVGWGGEGGMVGNIGLLASHLSHLTKSHRPQKDILPKGDSGDLLIDSGKFIARGRRPSAIKFHCQSVNHPSIYGKAELYHAINQGSICR